MKIMVKSNEYYFSPLLLILSVLFSCDSQKREPQLDEVYLNSLRSYRETLAEKSRMEYLQLIGRYQLYPDQQNFIGTRSDQAIMIEYEEFPEELGMVHFTPDSLIFASAGFLFNTADGSLDSTVQLPRTGWFRSEDYQYGRFSWHFLNREGNYFLRVRDHEHPEAMNFKGYDWFEPTAEFVLDGEFTYFDQPLIEEVPSTLDFKENSVFIGRVKFNYRDEPYTLDVGEEGFTTFADETSADQTYGAGRYLYITLPEKNGPVQVDFNYAYNPACIFSEFTTCKFAPPQNRLPFKVLAGETATPAGRFEAN